MSVESNTDWPAVIARLRQHYTLTVIAHRVGYADHSAIWHLQKKSKGEPVYSKGCALLSLLNECDNKHNMHKEVA